MLRRFRDETLTHSFWGRVFIRLYYKLSPPLARRLKNMKMINAFVRHVLDHWVARIENDNKSKL